MELVGSFKGVRWASLAEGGRRRRSCGRRKEVNLDDEKDLGENRPS